MNKQLYYQNTVAVTFGCGKNQVKNLLQIFLANLNFVHWQTTESAICLVNDNSVNTRGNPLLPLHGLWLISSKGSFTCTIPKKVKYIPFPLFLWFSFQRVLHDWCNKRPWYVLSCLWDGAYKRTLNHGP